MTARVPQPEALFAHQFWVPVSMCGQVGIGDRLDNRRQTWLRMIGRLKPQTTLPQFQVEANVIAKQIEAADPERARDLSFAPYHETDGRLAGISGVREFGWILQAIVLLVLAIARTNIANLRLARSLARTKEIDLRLVNLSGTVSRYLLQRCDRAHNPLQQVHWISWGIGPKPIAACGA